MRDMQQKLIELFPPELRTASIVPRWSVVFTLMRDTVASHSYYVAMYAWSIADLIDWRLANYALLTYLALTHDLDELSTGDIVAPAKAEILNQDRHDAFVQLKMRERMPAVAARLESFANCFQNPAKERQLDEAWSIITVADRLDALLFLITEQRLGNGVVATRIPSAEARLYSAFMELPKDKNTLAELWNTVMKPVIGAHQTDGGNGV